MPRFFGLLTRTAAAEWSCEFPDLTGLCVRAPSIALLRTRARVSLQRALMDQRSQGDPETTPSSREKVSSHPYARSALLFCVEVEAAAAHGRARASAVARNGL